MAVAALRCAAGFRGDIERIPDRVRDGGGCRYGRGLLSGKQIKITVGGAADGEYARYARMLRAHIGQSGGES